jgi:hypothetical protein
MAKEANIAEEAMIGLRKFWLTPAPWSEFKYRASGEPSMTNAHYRGRTGGARRNN